LLAVPNVSEGRDAQLIDALERAFAAGVSLLDRHVDADHDRSVFTVAGEPGALSEALVRGAAAAIRSIDMTSYRGLHPAIGALDVCPLVWPSPGDRDRARGTARAVAVEIGALGVPVFLYGELATVEDGRERAYFRNGGLTELRLRLASGELRPDYGPPAPHRSAGAALLTARPPLAAFNVELDVEGAAPARAIAARLRESGGGLPGVRAMGLSLGNGRAQVSTNVHDPTAVPLGAVVERVRELAAPLGARPIEAELVGLAPAAALVDYPGDVPIRDFDPQQRTIEARLADLS
jgi:glutamate formiminotransferase/glutamate formiminotransferase/formiminotetrahydrofolate cyclodeaminase